MHTRGKLSTKLQSSSFVNPKLDKTPVICCKELLESQRVSYQNFSEDLNYPMLATSQKSPSTQAEVDNPLPTPKGSKLLALCLAAIICVISGVGAIIFGKLQFRVKVKECEGCETIVYYQQPLVQTFCMFVAMSLCLVIHFVDVTIRHRKGGLRGYGKLEFIEPPSRALEMRLTPWWWFALPSLADFLGTSMINAAFTLTYASTVQLLRNSIILVTAVFTMLVMRRPLVIHQWLGIIIMSAGMCIAGADSLMHPEEATNSSNPMLGIGLTLAGTVMNAVTLIAEESFLTNLYSAPMRAVGWCGVTGMMWCALFCPIAHLVGLIDLKLAWFQSTQDILITQIALTFMLGSFLFNASGMIVTQLGSGLLKSLIYSCRGPLMWLFEIIQGWQKYSLYGFVGLIGTFFGFIVYTDILYPSPPRGSFWRKPIACGPCMKQEEEVVEEEKVEDEVVQQI